jgi:hypothetical protein
MKKDQYTHWFELKKTRFPRSGLTKNIKRNFEMQIIKAFVEQCGDLFYDEYVPVEISIIVEETAPKSMDDAQVKKLCDNNMPFLKAADSRDAVNRVVSALNGASFHNANQVVSVSYLKTYGWVDKIKIGIGVFRK